VNRLVPQIRTVTELPEAAASMAIPVGASLANFESTLVPLVSTAFTSRPGG
jgi:hypothetical protein